MVKFTLITEKAIWHLAIWQSRNLSKLPLLMLARIFYDVGLFLLSECDCGTLKITLPSSANRDFLQGSYEEHVAINGRPSWILNKAYALFYSPKNKDWVLSLLRAIGTPYGFIFANSDGEELCPKDVPSTSWDVQLTETSSAPTTVTMECLTSRNERKNFGSILSTREYR